MDKLITIEMSTKGSAFRRDLCLNLPKQSCSLSSSFLHILWDEENHCLILYFT